MEKEKREISLLDRFRNQSTQKYIPLQASLELTNRCNERCTHCYIDDFSDDPKKSLDLEGWRKVLEELRSAGTLYVILMGGEAMLSPLFWEVLQECRKRNFHTSMISNGLKINSLEMAQKLAEQGIANITFSLYSTNPDIHDVMTRVRGSHRKTTQAIEWCLESGIDVSINCLLTRNNIESVFELEDWCVERGLELKVDPMVTPKLSGNLEPVSLRASKPQLESFYRKRAERWKNGLPQFAKEESSSFVCNAAKGKCAVTAYGELLPCIEIRESMGKLTEESFKTIWQSETAKKWRSLFIKDLKDYPLKKEGSLCEHCPGMAKNEDDDPLQTSSYARELAEIKWKVRQEFLKRV